MKIEIMIAVLGIICIGSLAAVFILWAKLDEQKKLTKEEHIAYRNALEYGNAIAEALREEHERRWNEISRAMGLEKIAEEYAEEKERYENNMSYADKTLVRLTKQNNASQDKLSALLCPTNNHVWKDGVCTKCGRVKDDD